MSEPEESSWVVKFVSLTSTVDSSFWVSYCREKLDKIKLSETPLDITASYTVGTPRLQLQESSLGVNSSISNDKVALAGILKGYNTLEAFQKEDKNQLLQQVFCDKFLESSETIYSSFLLLTFADLKNHKVLYWFSVPAMMPRSGSSIRAIKQESLEEAGLDRENLVQEIRNLRVARGDSCPPYFLVDGEGRVSEMAKSSFTALGKKDAALFGFFDPSISDSTASASTMGWPMRNLVAYLSIHLGLGGETVRILSYRPKRLRRVSQDDMTWEETEEDFSLILHVKVPLAQEYEWDDNRTHKAVGWELNARSKHGPRWVHLRPLLDEHHLAVQAADLNLKLMKWRMLPDLQLEKLQGLKVLCIGAGTLGCSVARILLGWGVRKIKFVDNGQVSYSNPVRQSLFTLQDCKEEEKDKGGGGGRRKSLAAAEALRSIVADVESEGIVLSIPMPGHAETRESLEASVPTLDALVEECDVVFLLTDTRESRWLPTVMAASHDKILLNSALGLDSWLVMRHGAGTGENRLGCYFCNDVVAPENSMKNRTLDQQCTVTRPGLSPIASSMVVELMVALLHHPKQQAAPAPKSATSAFSPTISSTEDDDASSALGVMPHQIRGSLVTYTMMTPTVPAFSFCTGCSPAVIEAYREDKMELVYRVCQSTDGSFLEDLSGLTAFRTEAASKMEMVDGWDEDDIEIED